MSCCGELEINDGPIMNYHVIPPFSMTFNNPVFFDNELYFLGVHGNIGVFNPDAMTWWVLNKPERVRDGAHDYGDRYCYLVEFKGDLIAIFRPYDVSPIEMFKLGRSNVSWTKMSRLDDSVLFLDNWNATILSMLVSTTKSHSPYYYLHCSFDHAFPAYTRDMFYQSNSRLWFSFRLDVRCHVPARYRLC